MSAGATEKAEPPRCALTRASVCDPVCNCVGCEFRALRARRRYFRDHVPTGAIYHGLPVTIGGLAQRTGLPRFAIEARLKDGQSVAQICGMADLDMPLPKGGPRGK